MNRFKWLIAIVGLCIGTETFALDTEHVLWDKTPIHLNIPLDEERLIRFPLAVSIVDNEASDALSILKVQDVIYVKAKEPFENKRLLVQLMPQGEVIILNLSAKKELSESKPVEVVLSENDEETTTPETANPFDFNDITLTRFAIQSLYAPQRLLVIPEGVGRVPMQTHKLISLVYGASLEARPLISWRGGSLYVTAVELKNLLNKEVVIDPRRMVGHWQTATFYPTNTLSPRGKEDTTTVFLISERPFHEALASTREYVR